MREAQFLRQNADQWKAFEALLSQGRKADADRLAEGFIQLTDDLAYARTFYPKSPTTRYLNGLAAQVHQAIYRNKKEERGRFVRFWAEELPLTVRAAHRELLIALVVFAIALGIGALSAAGDRGFARLIMGDGYINITLENIEKGDPMAVYKQMNELDMFLAITLNNVRVALYAFAAGVLFSFGTGFVLFQNGVMLGAFQYFFHEQGLLWTSLLVIYIHGALEISAIVIAGGAGLVMGNSLLFPGTYTRVQSFMRGARRGLKIVIGLVPIFVVAGFLEGFVTRHTSMPVALSLLIILGSLGFIGWYFVYYPIRLARRARRHRTSASSAR
ncbi:MAG: stage II sporulation protein M [Rhodothermales bacterium]